MSKLNRWILSLTLLALVVVGGVVLADGGFGTNDTEPATACPLSGGIVCEAAADTADCAGADSEFCAQNKAGCEDGAEACLGRSANRPLDGAGRRCGGGQARRVGGCRGGR